MLENKRFHWRAREKIRKEVQMRKEAFYEMLRRAQWIVIEQPMLSYYASLMEACCQLVEAIDGMHGARECPTGSLAIYVTNKETSHQQLSGERLAGISYDQ